MRHATSEMNEAMTEETKLGDKFNYFDVALNRDLQDATLSLKGQQEAIQQRQLV